MAHQSRRVTSKDRDGAATSRQGRQSTLLRLVPKAESLPRKSPVPEPYEDFDILLTAGHNIG